MGNIFSLRNALERQGVKSFLSKSRKQLSEADAIVLPGVGGFRAAAESIPRVDLVDLASSGKLIAGICLGMQLFLERSEEGPGKGLGLLPGSVRRLPSRVKIPHMGWNTITLARDAELTDGLSEMSWVYYVHSYYPETSGDWVVGTTRYGVQYPGLICKGNLVGAQFHPEKSGPAGARILSNIVRMAK